MSLMFGHRVANLRKLFPYLPDRLNAILMHFAAGAADPCQPVDDFLADLSALFA